MCFVPISVLDHHPAAAHGLNGPGRVPALCYGIKWSGLRVGDPPLCARASGQADVEVRQVLSTAPFRPGTGSHGESAAIALVTGGWIALDRGERTATFHLPALVGPEELVHPYLVPAAAVFCSWAGREAYHAGAFVVGGKAWAVVGDREGGKSTTLAALALFGLPVLSDDLLVLDDRSVLQGPRLIDLRQPSAMRMGLGQPVESAREGGRWRMRLGPAPDVELAGWVFLRWGSGVDIRKTSLAERVNRLLALRPTKAEAVLSLASLPAYDFVRPRNWDLLPGALDRLLMTLGRGGSLG